MDSEAKEQAVIDFLHEFMELCETNNYEKAELYTILKVQREYPTRNAAIQKELTFVLNQLYSKLFDQQNYTLAGVVNGIIMLDIDDFKQVNDNYGHLNGDIVLKRLGQIISKETNNEIKAYRYGGEEFIVLVEKPVLPYIKAISQRIRRHMEEQEWEFNKDLMLTISIGCAIGSGEDDVVQKADDNLYISKTNGKNQVTM